MEEITYPKKWDEIQSKLKQSYPNLTNEDLHYKEGGEQEMLRMVEYKLRKIKQEMQEIITGLLVIFLLKHNFYKKRRFK